jgi:hypothetical protein
MSAHEVTIISVTHDLQGQRSVVLIKWDEAADRRLSLPIPFNTQLDDLLPATHAAIRKLLGGRRSGRCEVIDRQKQTSRL